MSTTPNAERKTLILTGASRGIGHATVKRFASAGWRVITCSRHAFPENCPWEMGPEDHIQVDLANARGHRARHRRDAGAARRRRAPASMRWSTMPASRPRARAGARLGAIETSLEDWQHVFQVNFFAPIMLARGLIAELERAKGAVVNVTSIAGGRVHPFAGAAYATSKAALAALTREMAAEFGPRGIRVNAISPGEIDTADPLARHRQDRARADPAAAAGRAGGGGQGHLFPVHRPVELRERRRAAHQRRPARVTPLRGPRRRLRLPERQHLPGGPYCLRLRATAISPLSAGCLPAAGFFSVGRSVAQPGSALASGARGREFESPRSDQYFARK